VVATGAALVFDIVEYEAFLFVIGSVFVPLFATFAVAYFVLDRGRWDMGEDAPARPWMLLPWAAGFATYQLISPPSVAAWQDFWLDRQADLAFVPPGWMSASLTSFAVAALLTVVVGRATRRR